MRNFLLILTLLLIATTTVLLWVTEGVAPENDAPVVTKASAGVSAHISSSPLEGKSLVGGAFTLTNHLGETVSDESFRGRFMLVFFGFTRCPDICPTAVGTMTRALEKLGDKADAVAPILISVDPAHDTPQVMADFLKPFDKRFIGLTGTKEQIKQVAGAYKAYFSPIPDTDVVDHSGLVYLMGKDGQYLRHFSGDVTDSEMAEAIAAAIH